MLWPKASPLDLDFGLCAWAKLFNIYCFVIVLLYYYSSMIFEVADIWQQMAALDKESTRSADWERIELDTTRSTIKFEKTTTTNNKR